MTLAEAVQTIRRREGLTQIERAELAGLSPSAVRQVEQGQRTAPVSEPEVRLSLALDVATDDFAECDVVRFRPRKPRRVAG